MIRIVDVYPLAGTFAPQAKVTLQVEIEADGPFIVDYVITHLTEERASGAIEGIPEVSTVSIEWDGADPVERGYGVDLTLSDRTGVTVATAHTAFDVLESWTEQPRYGFLSDFEARRDDPSSIVAELAKFHINGIQFYDWQYRHDDPLPPSDVFVDPLGRELSWSRIRNLVDRAHEHGMAAMAYLAVYAASVDFWEEHPDWALYDEEGEPISFEGFLGLMDPREGSPWANHLLARIDDVLGSTGFDGIHIDQYGEPRVAFDACGGEVDLPGAFVDFVADVKTRHPRNQATFNAVKNWPIDALVRAPMDFVYIEIWPDTPTYRELGQIVASARSASSYRAVVVAVYIPAEHEANVRLANAVIAANGGTRIEIGEGGRLLTDPYFPKHKGLPPPLYAALRRSSDFAVRYGSLLFPASAPAALEVEAVPGVMATAHRVGRYGVVRLVNVGGSDSPRWDQQHLPPVEIEHRRISVASRLAPTGVFACSPDSLDPRLRAVEWMAEDGRVHVDVPRIEYLTAVIFDFGPEGGG